MIKKKIHYLEDEYVANCTDLHTYTSLYFTMNSYVFYVMIFEEYDVTNY